MVIRVFSHKQNLFKFLKKVAVLVHFFVTTSSMPQLDVWLTSRQQKAWASYAKNDEFLSYDHSHMQLASKTRARGCRTECFTTQSMLINSGNNSIFKGWMLNHLHSCCQWTWTINIKHTHGTLNTRHQFVNCHRLPSPLENFPQPLLTSTQWLQTLVVPVLN